MSDDRLAGNNLMFAPVHTQKAVKNALPVKQAIRELCTLMNIKHPGMRAGQMAETLARMGFNYFTASTTAQEWRKEHGMKP